MKNNLWHCSLLKNISKILIALGLITGCKTTSELLKSRQSNYVDPTQVQTVGNNAAPMAPESENLARELAVTQGELDSLKYTSQQNEEKLKSQIVELQKQNQLLVTEFNKLKMGTPTSNRPLAVSGDMPQKSGAPLLWELALRDIKAARFVEASASLEELIKSYPKAPHVPYALLGLGMSQYNADKASEAAITFNLFIDKHGSHARAPLAWFGQGASLFYLKQTDDARLIFEEVKKRFPKTFEATLAKRILEKKEKNPPQDLFAAFPQWAAGSPR